MPNWFYQDGSFTLTAYALIAVAAIFLIVVLANALRRKNNDDTYPTFEEPSSFSFSKLFESLFGNQSVVTTPPPAPERLSDDEANLEDDEEETDEYEEDEDGPTNEKFTCLDGQVIVEIMWHPSESDILTITNNSLSPVEFDFENDSNFPDRLCLNPGGKTTFTVYSLGDFVLSIGKEESPEWEDEIDICRP